MGSYSPVRGADAEFVEEIVETVHRPVVAELAARGTPFSGLLYAGLMLTPDGPRVLEFNARFGDPETQSILPRLDGDLLEALHGAATASLRDVSLDASDRATVTVVLAGRSYPEASDSGTPIAGVDAAEAAGALVFHAGTALLDGALVTNGGRILDVTAVGDTVAEARERAYAGVDLISWPGIRYRRDIAGAVHV